MTVPTATAEDILALRRLTDDYGSTVDNRDGDGFAGVFTPDGELAVYEPGEDEPSLVYTGYDELVSVIELVKAFTTTMHLMANHQVDIDGDTATGMVYGLSLHLTESGGRGVDTLMVMKYRDRYARTDKGWKIARRDVLRQWTEYNAGERARLVG
jgi:hypothetical protein